MRPSVALQDDPKPATDDTEMNDSLPELGDLEREVMQLVWAGGPLTAEAVRERLSRRLKESTVRTVLRRLEDKGFTTHTVDGRTYVYQAAEPRGRVAAKAVQRIVDWFCNGSVEEVLVGMVDSAMLDQRQLRMLTDKVASAKENNKEKAKEKSKEERVKEKVKGGK
jgi:BlaI family penicillinase repressor